MISLMTKYHVAIYCDRICMCVGGGGVKQGGSCVFEGKEGRFLMWKHCMTCNCGAYMTASAGLGQARLQYLYN